MRPFTAQPGVLPLDLHAEQYWLSIHLPRLGDKIDMTGIMTAKKSPRTEEYLRLSLGFETRRGEENVKLGTKVFIALYLGERARLS